MDNTPDLYVQNLMEAAQEWGQKGVAFLADCIERFIGFLGSAGSKISDTMSELGGSMKSACKNGLESFRPSPSPTPSVKPEITPAMDISPAQAPAFSPSMAVQNALANVDLSFATAGDDAFDIGCASPTYGRFAMQNTERGY